MGSPRTSPRVKKKQRTKPPCWCSKVGSLCLSLSDILPADLDKDEIRKQLQDAQKEQLHIERGGGHVDEISIDDCNESFIKKFYPNLAKETNSWPLVFQPKHPSESSFDMKTQLGKEDGRVGNRIGDEAEQKTFQTLLAMFKLHKIASFTLSGYAWMQYLPCKILPVLTKIPTEDIAQEGESDLLVLLPGRGVLAIEVKSKKKGKGLSKAMAECFEQCEKAITFVACSTLDIIPENNFKFVKVASLPYCSRCDIESMTCQKCSPHFITVNDLQSSSTLFEWFEKLPVVYLYKDWRLDSKVYESIVARFIGPLSRVKVKALPEIINDTHKDLEEYGSLEQIKSKWVQLNEAQSETAFPNPRFLWITGDPGSGKTILALWKIQEMLKRNENHVIYLIAGNRDMLLIHNMKMLFDSRLTQTKTGTVLNIKTIEDVFVKTSDWFGLNGLLDVIKRLTLRHVDSQVSIILDEFWYYKKDSSDKLNIPNGNLKNVWIIQSSSCKILPNISTLKPLRFKKIKLQRIMRMSESNVKFLSCLQKNLKVGHAVQGLPPVLYTMECMCKKLKAENEPTCIPFLIKRLTEEVLANFMTLPRENVEINISEDVVVITRSHVKVKKLLSQKHLEVTVRPALFFTGCEKKFVIVDLWNVGGSGNYKANLIEALTRATGRLVLLDVSCNKDKESQMDVKKLVDCINEVPDTVLERGKDVNLNTTEISVLKREINLGLFRNEQYIQENMASAVTGKMLQETIEPLKEDIKEVKGNIFTIMQTLERIETSTRPNSN